MNLEIITPDTKVFSGEATSVIVPGKAGVFQVLENHAPMLSALRKGEIRYKTAGVEHNYAVETGVIEVLKNKVVILVETV